MKIKNFIFDHFYDLIITGLILLLVVMAGILYGAKEQYFKLCGLYCERDDSRPVVNINMGCACLKSVSFSYNSGRNFSILPIGEAKAKEVMNKEISQ